MERFLKKYYAITDRKQFKYDFEIQIKRMLDSGIRMFQLREKDLPSDEFFDLASKLGKLLSGYDASFFVNDRVDVAVLTGANGVHLPSKSIPIETVKHKFPFLIVGKSCHSVEEAVRAEKEGADYITFSPIFETPGKGKPKGLKALKEVVEAVSIPVYALGGITEEAIPEVLKIGVYGIAGIRLFIK
ncbi:thiamine-phosphate pyrophosphorylase [Persephonella hydrogeniphila]|uniref:Thiamine-phosphate pyrophosphorylase n=1 Tax=Persephonella hydrogeniphila TaxID=198703 RepID=A0A285N6X3_9AQUI|nr:thiamine phosphate synthase [Persephonella hydrogeniphila]SNZ03461.1 thiamine-phosphate pyrophosphorylase [Persephonella hydrogeniphila]